MFVRSLLAMSLSCILANVAFAAPTTEQPLKPQKISAVQDPIDPLAIDYAASSSSAVSSAASEPQLSPNPAANVAQTIENTPEVPVTAAPAREATLDTATTATKTPSQAPEVPASWTMDAINSAEWYEDMPRRQLPVYARAHVMLNNAHASPGAIDGSNGQNTLKAIASFQQMNGLTPTGQLTKETWDALVAKQTKPAYVEYTITEADLKGPYAESIPTDYALQAKMKGLYYTRVTEMLGEKFHMDERFLRQLNPRANFNKVGEKIVVANVRNDLPEDIHLIVAHKGAKQLYLFNSRNQMIASFPATIGSTSTPSPTGTYKVTGVAKNPWYSYSPSNFVQGKNLKPLSLPPGPNGPVGNIWIGLSKKSFGIHGTPNPSMISKNASHGCIRLTNWDANDLGNKVRAGVTVRFLE
ncbi:L,D-transpeptidase family protein [Acinetobacter haemolyticus]|uniref:L,D-transpeptidase family protein n=1 Tax=Acinetobacter haemolyticus TaxID=29430 RepID=UPI000C2CCB3D|nr:L,D-transpeptidase [Acinetobacter haemolyticus]ATZ66942.1 murein L,D-transpeptidase [Acinetobacter haemolyticus]MCU4379270.1 L,D-transpeptidase [Acinetobacter haemolyticus]MCU4388584.1 L,D-transpeptidase [Acinetobacter haemolyticus]MEB6677865.1 L,D-transpeptidase [Acinetobacter haemolyticus]MQZ30083.1 murein L,D-transpeptidase [Acinetobacter haemolyticus]